MKEANKIDMEKVNTNFKAVETDFSTEITS